ncbi:MAG: dipeptidyl aminopeptidase/acylaminoacyl peptidase [Planctomycetota bacterium]|jgi:dipeptidyl aminopeptidase/acylaminoacyl peptidase
MHSRALLKSRLSLCLLALPLLAASVAATQSEELSDVLEPMDVFELERALDPQISPDGDWVVYSRSSMDVMRDRTHSRLWLCDYAGTTHRPLTQEEAGALSARWSPDGDRLVYVTVASGSSQIHMRWMDTGQSVRLTHLPNSPGSMSWSPDGKWLAFTMFVEEKPQAMASMPSAPEGAQWAEPATVIESLRYRADGQGYVEQGYSQVFMLPAEGGTARQLTMASSSISGPLTWTPAGAGILFSANLHEDADYQPGESAIYQLDVASGDIEQLTDRLGPESNPRISPDGSLIAFTGYVNEYLGYQPSQIWLMGRDGSDIRSITPEFDRNPGSIRWAGDSKGLFYSFDDRGETFLGYVSTGGEQQVLAGDLGGLSLGRPYASASFSVSGNGRYAYTIGDGTHLADVAVGEIGSAKVSQLTRLNEDLFAFKKPAAVEEFWCKSSVDELDIQGWIVKPPHFDAEQKYPLILEIHGGPFANYGKRFSMEAQLFAAAGYVVVYTNPRGSTSYGKAFANEIHHNYPSNDYDDLISCVDHVIGKGYVDAKQLYVTGGSGGGVLTAWIVGKTDRFRAAVVAKPVINWTSFVLTADAYTFFTKYWFAGMPWEEEHREQYWKRSPLSLVGNVTTPTMLLTGEEDYRTPISESEQYYQALKLRRVDTALVRIPGASHGITSRPSRLITKVAHILAWFERYGAAADGEGVLDDGGRER